MAVSLPRTPEILSDALYFTTWLIFWAFWALWRHRWSEHGREVDLLIPDQQQERGMGALRRHLRQKYQVALGE